MDETVLHKLKATVAQAFSGRGFLAAYAYGSRVSGNPLPGSDLDVGYYLTGFRSGASLSLGDEALLASELSEALGVEVDLRNLAEAPLELRGRVLEEGVRIYSGDDAMRVGLERDLLGRYHDYKETFRRMHELRIESVRERGI